MPNIKMAQAERAGNRWGQRARQEVILHIHLRSHDIKTKAKRGLGER